MHPFPIHDFDLDLAPAERWKEIFDVNAKKIVGIRTEIKKILNSIGYGSISLITKPIISLLKMSGKLFYTDEITYIATRMGMTFDEVLVLQLIYECSSACTSAVLRIGNDDIFFRTMDWPMDFLRDTTIQLNIKKRGNIIAQGITWIGYVGLLTAITVPNSFSGNNLFGMSINYRKTKEITLGNIITNAFRTFNMKWPIGYLVRDIIESCCSSRNAITRLTDALLISPCYITVFVPNDQSVIITRDAEKTISVRSANLVQTNCDHDKTEPDILWSCQRRELVARLEAELNNSTNDVTISDILKKMLVFPIKNDETIYVYCNYKGHSEGYVL